jgi:hypothetical protein
MTKTERQQIAAAFRAARRVFVRRGARPICSALQDSRHEARNAARRVVQGRIGERLYVHEWLVEVAKVPREFITYENVRAYRLRWLDSLIEEFSK